jgi:Tfp pilus assembly protein PilN
MKWALTSFRFIVIVVELIVIVGFLLRFWLDVQISDLDDEITQKSALISSQVEFEKEFRNIQTKLTLISEITNSENLALTVFEEVVASLPGDIQLTTFTRQAAVVSISGNTANENSITGFMTNLEGKDRFGTVRLEQISTKENSQIIEFSLGATLKEGGG